MEYTPPLQYLIRQSLKRFFSLSIITLCLILFIRLYEIFFISVKAGYPIGSNPDLLSGIWFDLLLSFRLSAILLLPFLLIDHYRQKVAIRFFASVSVFVVVADVVLLRYFSASRIPLGSDILGYSFSEIQQTIGASGEMNLNTLLPIILFLIFGVHTFYRWWDIKIPYPIMVLFTIGMFVSLFSNLNPDQTAFKNEFRMNITANKFSLFTGSITSFLHGDEVSANYELNASSNVPADISPDAVKLANSDGKLNESNTKKAKLKGTSTANSGITLSSAKGSSDANSMNIPAVAGNPFIYISQNYPFLHEEHTPDFLEPFFKPGTQAPSIVFIVVESLGRAYTGEKAYLGSFTPFLDSLMSKSLYWENCLSTSGRTFSVIPSLLASLPFGEKGFANLDNRMPDHLSLVSLLKNRAGYSSSFYYGGDAKFDDMEPFMKRQGATKIVGINDFGSDYKQLPASSSGFTWGYGDHEIFRKYLTDLKSNEREKRVDVMLTLAMHSPFKIPDQSYYNDLVEKRMTEINLNGDEKKYHRQYSAQFATIMYFDEALRYFFKEFSKLKSFENTIFVLTGDHRMPEIPISTQLDRFHVPLVIYSPLLKKGQKFSSVVTHYDVTPSLLSLLKKRMKLSLPSVSAWIGHGLDTNVSFRNLNSYPLKRNTGELTDFISGNHFLSGTTLYRVYNNLDIEPENNADLLNQLQSQFDNYKAKNIYATKGNQLIPDSLKKYNNP
ncbi:MAG: LTA synthase family protein [Prolixibacteraceae bacterium]